MKRDLEKMIQADPSLKYDPYIKQQLKKEIRMQECRRMNLMLSRPQKSGWIELLQNRVNLNSVGNLRFKTKVYYDRNTNMVGENPQQCTTPFRLAKLKNGQKAMGWIECTNP